MKKLEKQLRAVKKQILYYKSTVSSCALCKEFTKKKGEIEITKCEDCPWFKFTGDHCSDWISENYPGIGWSNAKKNPQIVKTRLIMLNEWKYLLEKEIKEKRESNGGMEKLFNSKETNMEIISRGIYRIKRDYRGSICEIIGGKLNRIPGVNVPGVLTNRKGQILVEGFEEEMEIEEMDLQEKKNRSD